MSLMAHQLDLQLSKRRVVRGISLEVRDGEVLGLIGPNGAGKSTLLRGLAGLLPPAAGDVMVDGSRLQEQSARARASVVSFVAQDTTVAADLTALDLVLMGRYSRRKRLQRLSPEDWNRAHEALGLVGLARLGSRPVQDLSGGERQLAQIARAVAQDASTLLLDEPTSALDLHHGLRVFDVLRKRADEGAGVAVVLHDLDEAARHCDRLAVIHDGGLHTIGSPPEVLSPRLLEQVYRVRASVETCQGCVRVAPVRALEPHGLTEPSNIDTEWEISLK